MTVQGDLERAIAMAEAAKGNYLLFSTESADGKAQNVFSDMAEDMDRHVQILQSRREYLNQHNQLNQSGQGGQGGQNGSQGGNDKQGQGKKKDQNQQQ